MKICYVDEAGCTGALPNSTSKIQPTLSLIGFFVDYSKLHELTKRLIELKQRFFPRLAPNTTTYMGWILPEIKGGDLRRDACDTRRNTRRAALTYLSELMKLCKDCDAKIAGRVWVKGIGMPLNGMSVYTYSIQSIYADFQQYLTAQNDVGVVIVDSRLKHLNVPVAHSVFTQKFKSTGDTYDRIIELPAFSHSDNHAGLQVADTLCSAIVTPIAIFTYCTGHIQSVYVRPGYQGIKAQFAADCRALQHRYTLASGQSRGGLVVSDSLGHQVGGLMWR
jgi:hypothetical protein